MSRFHLAVLAALLLAPGAGRAEDMPRQLNDELIRTERANCKTSDRKSTRLNSSHNSESRMPSSA
jgi:hypothetical protein